MFAAVVNFITDALSLDAPREQTRVARRRISGCLCAVALSFSYQAKVLEASSITHLVEKFSFWHANSWRDLRY
jgi:hypothetical protein